MEPSFFFFSSISPRAPSSLVARFLLPSLPPRERPMSAGDREARKAKGEAAAIKEAAGKRERGASVFLVLLLLSLDLCGRAGEKKRRAWQFTLLFASLLLEHATVSASRKHTLSFSLLRGPRARERALTASSKERAQKHTPNARERGTTREREKHRKPPSSLTFPPSSSPDCKVAPPWGSLSLSLSPQRVRFRAPLPPSLFEAQAHVLLLMPAHK